MCQRPRGSYRRPIHRRRLGRNRPGDPIARLEPLEPLLLSSVPPGTPLAPNGL